VKRPIIGDSRSVDMVETCGRKLSGECFLTDPLLPPWEERDVPLPRHALRVRCDLADESLRLSFMDAIAVLLFASHVDQSQVQEIRRLYATGKYSQE
jgi:hypothetical protein